MTWNFHFHNIDIWGTVITIQAPTTSISKSIFEDVCRQAHDYFRHIDEKFSTFKEDSEVSSIRSHCTSLDEASPETRWVWNRCLELKDLTLGAFDPWSLPHGFDPSGFVKGWAAQEAISLFTDAGIRRIQINAGGDVVVRGGYDDETPWKIGIRHPDFPDQIAKTFELFDGAVASSGNYERGAHIIDPRMGVPAVGARAATVVGPDAGVADALATALIVDGRDSVNWLGDDAFREYEFWAVDKSGDGAWSYRYSDTTPS